MVVKRKTEMKLPNCGGPMVYLDDGGRSSIL